MKSSEIKNVIKIISEASPSHLFLVSFLGLPFIINSWLEVFSDIFGSSIVGKIVSILILLAVYSLCIIWMIKENSKNRDMERKRDQLIGRMISNNWKTMRFERARRSLTDISTDEDIISIIECFPKSLCYVKRIKKDSDVAGNENGEEVYDHCVGLVSRSESAPENSNA